MSFDIKFTRQGFDNVCLVERILGECLLRSSLPGKALITLVDIARLVERILGECLLISRLPGKALRMLVDIARLAEI